MQFTSSKSVLLFENEVSDRDHNEFSVICHNSRFFLFTRSKKTEVGPSLFNLSISICSSIPHISFLFTINSSKLFNKKINPQQFYYIFPQKYIKALKLIQIKAKGYRTSSFLLLSFQGA